MTRLVLIDCKSKPTRLATYEGRKQLYAFTFPAALGLGDVEFVRCYQLDEVVVDGPEVA